MGRGGGAPGPPENTRDQGGARRPEPAIPLGTLVLLDLSRPLKLERAKEQESEAQMGEVRGEGCVC